MNYFSDYTTRDDIRNAYRRLAKVLHPDAGGSTEKMQTLNAQYDEAMDKATRNEMPENTPAPNNRFMTKQQFENFIFKHAPQRAKGYEQVRFLRWFNAFGQDLGTATKVWKAWNDMSLPQCAYLASCDELDRHLS